MWPHICMAGTMMAYRCDVTSVLAAQMLCRPTNFCLLLLSAIPYFTYFVTMTIDNISNLVFSSHLVNKLEPWHVVYIMQQ